MDLPNRSERKLAKRNRRMMKLTALIRRQWKWIAGISAALATTVALGIQVVEHLQNKPNLEIEIARISFYDDFDVDSQVPPDAVNKATQNTVPNEFRPWVGIVVSFTNSGMQPATVAEMAIEFAYINVPGLRNHSTYYLDATRTADNPLGDRPRISVMPGEQQFHRVTALLDLPLDSTAKTKYASALDRQLANASFSVMRVVARDINRQEIETPNFFANPYQEMKFRRVEGGLPSVVIRLDRRKIWFRGPNEVEVHDIDFNRP